MTTRKFRFDPGKGQLAPISVSAHEELVHARGESPMFVRALRWLLVVVALAVSAFVFSLVQ